MASLNVECCSNDKLTDEECYELCDVIITIGGDGTLIKHAKEAARYGKACLGVNTGNLGFLANVDKDTVDLLKRLKTGEYTTESRMMMEICAVKDGERVFEGMALNDAVVSSGSVGKIADIKLECSIHDFRVVIGETHTNLIFDVALPFESKLSEREVEDKIAGEISARRDNHFCVITIDRV